MGVIDGRKVLRYLALAGAGAAALAAVATMGWGIFTGGGAAPDSAGAKTKITGPASGAGAAVEGSGAEAADGQAPGGAVENEAGADIAATGADVGAAAGSSRTGVGAAATRAEIYEYGAGAGSRRRSILAASQRLGLFIEESRHKDVSDVGPASPEHYQRLVLLLPAQILIAFQDGFPVKVYPTTIGTPDQPTPVGTYTVINRVEDPTWYPPDGSPPVPPGPDNPIGHRWIGIDEPGYGLHGTNESESIGTSQSLGCIRLFPDDVEHLFERVTPGTPVEFVYERIWVMAGPADAGGEKGATAVMGLFPDPYKRSELTFGHVAEALLDLDFPVVLEKPIVEEWIARAEDGPLLIFFRRPATG